MPPAKPFLKRVKYKRWYSKVWEIKPRTGDLVIFPGWITHSCTENENDEDKRNMEQPEQER